MPPRLGRSKDQKVDVALRAKFHAAIAAHSDQSHQFGIVGHTHFDLIPQNAQQGVGHFADKPDRLGARGSIAVQLADFILLALQHRLDFAVALGGIGKTETVAQGFYEVTAFFQIGQIALGHLSRKLDSRNPLTRTATLEATTAAMVARPTPSAPLALW